MENKKPFIPPPPEELKVPPRPASQETGKKEVKPVAATNAAAKPVKKQQVAPQSTPVVNTPKVQPAVAQPETKTENQAEKKKRSFAAPFAFVLWGSIAVVLIVLFIILKDKI